MNSDATVSTSLQRARDLCALLRFSEAEELCRGILAVAPEHSPATLMLAELVWERGDCEDAIRLLEPLAKRHPDSPAVHFSLGNAYRAAGLLKAAETALKRAILLQPNFPDALNSLGLVLHKLNDRDRAAQVYERAILLDSGFVEARLNLADLLFDNCQFEAAVQQLRGALAIDPQSARLHHRLGVALEQQHKYKEAVGSHTSAITLDPTLVEAYVSLSSALCGLGKADDALPHIRAAVTMRPDLAPAWNALGTALRAVGQFPEAAEAYEKAIALQPNYGSALLSLAAIRKSAQPDTEFALLKQLMADESQELDNRSVAALTLAKKLDALDRFEEAFAAAVVGNTLARKVQRSRNIIYDHAQLRAVNDRTISTFTANLFARRLDWGVASEAPVFIVGYFRSGTTLVEQICASHSQVFGAGELPDIVRYGRGLRQTSPDPRTWQPKVVQELASSHLTLLKDLNAKATRVVDKAPDNIYELGLIAHLFPQARVIFCHRDGRDSALSVFFNSFAREVDFATDLVDAGLRWHESERMADHWRTTLPLRMHHVVYEQLVRNFETEARRLIEFMGLEWEPGCLDFHTTDRTIMTPSNWQVRQPLFATSVGRWRNYLPHIGPLCDAIRIPPGAPDGTRPSDLARPG
jgi:tetratricopeptide (TPR) repeat protein